MSHTTETVLTCLAIILIICLVLVFTGNRDEQ